MIFTWPKRIQFFIPNCLPVHTSRRNDFPVESNLACFALALSFSDHMVDIPPRWLCAIRRQIFSWSRTTNLPVFQDCAVFFLAGNIISNFPLCAKSA
jgi:hypothetical protein